MTEITVVLEDGETKQVLASVVIDGALAAQEVRCDKGVCYAVVHIPSGQLLSPVAFSDLERCELVIRRIWDHSTDAMQLLWRSNNYDQIIAHEGMKFLAADLLLAVSDIDLV